MWSQDYLVAPWTASDVFSQLTQNLTNVDAGWVVFEDETAHKSYPYIIFCVN